MKGGKLKLLSISVLEKKIYCSNYRNDAGLCLFGGGGSSGLFLQSVRWELRTILVILISVNCQLGKSTFKIYLGGNDVIYPGWINVG